MKQYLKNNLILIILCLIFIALGILCILARGEDIIDIFSYLALVYLVLIGGWMIFSAIKYKGLLKENSNFLNKPLGYIIQGVILILAGITIVIFPKFLVRLIIGIILILLPLITLINHPDRIRYLRNNFWKFIIGLIFILAFDGVLDILFIVIGSILIGIACWIIYLLIINYKDKTYPNIITKYVLIYISKKNKG
jgi:hypothetical protein